MTSAPFDALRLWALEHLDALDDDVFDADEDGVLNSLRMVLEGNPGCAERGDYTDAQWEVLMAAQGKHRVTHGRHCLCSACAREDWTKITSPCGMHGPDCPAVYAHAEGGYVRV